VCVSSVFDRLAGSFPQLEVVDDISFLKPVEIGSIVHFRSVVAFSQTKTKHGTLINPAFELFDPDKPCVFERSVRGKFVCPGLGRVCVRASGPHDSCQASFVCVPCR
jgi:hypothetical protein